MVNRSAHRLGSVFPLAGTKFPAGVEWVLTSGSTAPDSFAAASYSPSTFNMEVRITTAWQRSGTRCRRCAVAAARRAREKALGAVLFAEEVVDGGAVGEGAKVRALRRRRVRVWVMSSCPVWLVSGGVNENEWEGLGSVPAEGFCFRIWIRSLTFLSAPARWDFLSRSSMLRMKISKLRSGSLERERKGWRFSW